MTTGNPKSLPKLDFNVTNRCNFRCVHCCFSSGEWKMPEFSIRKIKTVLKDFKRLGGWRIDITGGEALLRQDLDKIIKSAKNLGIKTELVTNGSLLSDEKLRDFKKLGLDDIAISLDGSSYKTYSKIRGTDRKSFKKVIDNIKKCVVLGFYTKVNTVVFNSNFRDLVKITKLCIKVGVNEHGFYYFSPIGRGKEKHEEVVDPLLWLKMLREDLIKFSDRIKISVEVPILEKQVSKKLNIACYMENPWHLQILPNGNVFPCAIMAAYERPFGNLYRQSLTNIWSDKRLWEEEYYKKEIKPLFKKYGGCVNYPGLPKLLKSGYQFVCLCRKFQIKDLLLKSKNSQNYVQNKTKK